MSEQQSFFIGQIFEGLYPPEAADFCNSSQNTDSPCYIKEIDPVNDTRRFQIVPNDPPDETEENRMKIMELEEYLRSTDWYAVRYAETGTPIPDDIKAARQNARDMISQLRGD